MPTTPVGQLPYPQGTDPPTIATDMKSLATQADGWVSALDAALSTRIGAVGTRLDAVTTRLTTTSTNLSASNASLTAGDTAITGAQNALTAVETRLNSQDTAASTLQTRYTTDNNNLLALSRNTPLGVTKIFPKGPVVSSSSGLNGWLATAGYMVSSASRPLFRVSFTGAINIYSANNSPLFELRLCYGIGGTVPSWNSYAVQTFYAAPAYSGWQTFSLSAIYGPGSVTNNTVALGIGYWLDSGSMTFDIQIQSGSIQYMTTG